MYKVVIIFMIIITIASSLHGESSKSEYELPKFSTAKADLLFGDKASQALQRHPPAPLVLKAMAGFEAFKETVPEVDAVTRGKIEYYYAHHLYMGKGADKNIPGAVHFAQLAANAGYANAQYAYGMALLNGRMGVAANISESISWLLKAVSQGYDAARESLYVAHHIYAERLYYGKGMTKNIPLAEKYYKLAADKGIPEAQYAYAKIIADAGDLEGHDHYIKLAADKGIVKAQYEYAAILKKEGKIAEAKVYLQRSADGGCADAQYAYAGILKKEGKTEEAMKFLRKAADGGCADAQYAYGRMLVANADPEGCKYLELAANQGHAAACEELAKMDGSSSSEDESPSAAAPTAGIKRRRGDG